MPVKCFDAPVSFTLFHAATGKNFNYNVACTCGSHISTEQCPVADSVGYDRCLKDTKACLILRHLSTLSSGLNISILDDSSLETPVCFSKSNHF